MDQTRSLLGISAAPPIHHLCSACSFFFLPSTCSFWGANMFQKMNLIVNGLQHVVLSQSYWQTKFSIYINYFAQISLSKCVTLQGRTNDAIASAGTVRLCTNFWGIHRKEVHGPLSLSLILKKNCTSQTTVTVTFRQENRRIWTTQHEIFLRM